MGKFEASDQTIYLEFVFKAALKTKAVVSNLNTVHVLGQAVRLGLNYASLNSSSTLNI